MQSSDTSFSLSHENLGCQVGDGRRAMTFARTAYGDLDAARWTG
jgi:hypothetical protein